MENKQIIFPEVTVESKMYYDSVLVILFICIVKSKLFSVLWYNK